MISSGSVAASMQPTGLNVKTAQVLSPSGSIPPPSMGIPGIGYPGEDKKTEEYDRTFQEYFSKGNLKLKIAEYFGGKYTERYIQNYIEFMVINGMLSNLEYLEFKNLIIAGKQS